MTVVGGKVQIVESLHTRLLSPAATGNSGALCGLKVEQSEVVVAAVGQLDKEGKVRNCCPGYRTIELLNRSQCSAKYRLKPDIRNVAD